MKVGPRTRRCTFRTVFCAKPGHAIHIALLNKPGTLETVAAQSAGLRFAQAVLPQLDGRTSGGRPCCLMAKLFTFAVSNRRYAATPGGFRIVGDGCHTKEWGVAVDEYTLQSSLTFFRFAGKGNVACGDHLPEVGFVYNGKVGGLAFAMAAAAALTPDGEQSICARPRHPRIRGVLRDIVDAAWAHRRRHRRDQAERLDGSAVRQEDGLIAM